MGRRGRGRRPLRDAAVTTVGHEVATNLLFYFLTVSLVQIVIRLLKRIKVHSLGLGLGPLNHTVSCCFSQAVEQTTGSDCVTVVGGEVCRDRCILLLQLVCSCVVVLPCGVRCEEQPSTSSQVWLAGFPPDS